MSTSPWGSKSIEIVGVGKAKLGMCFNYFLKLRLAKIKTRSTFGYSTVFFLRGIRIIMPH